MPVVGGSRKRLAAVAPGSRLATRAETAALPAARWSLSSRRLGPARGRTPQLAGVRLGCIVVRWAWPRSSIRPDETRAPAAPVKGRNGQRARPARAECREPREAF